MAASDLELAVLAAKTAGAIQRRRYGTALTVRNKGAVDLVTEVDLACEEAIRKLLAQHLPGDAICGEEGGATGQGERVWYIDPLDGTTNFARSIPVFCVSIACAVDGVLTTGVVYEPLREELFTATAGGGAWLNGRRISVTKRAELDSCLLATGFAYDYRTSKRHNFEAFAALYRASIGVRRLGAAALDLCYVAAGRFDGFWELGLKPWDTAAGTLLVREAGGIVTDLGGAPYDHRTPDVVATNGGIHPALLNSLTPFFHNVL